MAYIKTSGNYWKLVLKPDKLGELHFIIMELPTVFPCDYICIPTSNI